MGVYVEGEIDVAYSRELTADEYAAWLAKVRKGYPDAGPCQNPAHDKARLQKVEEPVGDRGAVMVSYRCEHFGESEEGRGGFCFDDSDRYNPEGWAIDTVEWGDIGQLEHGNLGFTIRAGGKVYDVEDACAFFVDALPADVTATGSGYFTSDSQPWGLIVRGREVREGWGAPVVEGDPAPAGSVVWIVDGIPFSSEEAAHEAGGAEVTTREVVR